MYPCPHCKRETISTWKKLSAGKALPAKCSNCGQKSYIGFKNQFIAQVLLGFLSFIFILPVIDYDQLWAITGIVLLALLLGKIFLLDRPMEKF